MDGASRTYPIIYQYPQFLTHGPDSQGSVNFTNKGQGQSTLGAIHKAYVCKRTCFASPLRSRVGFLTLAIFAYSSCVWFLLLLSVCIQCESSMRMLCFFSSVFGEFQAPLIGLEYELELVESFTMDPFRCKYS